MVERLPEIYAHIPLLTHPTSVEYFDGKFKKKLSLGVPLFITVGYPTGDGGDLWLNVPYTYKRPGVGLVIAVPHGSVKVCIDNQPQKISYAQIIYQKILEGKDHPANQIDIHSDPDTITASYFLVKEAHKIIGTVQNKQVHV